MSIPSFAVRRPVCIFICILSLIIFGLSSLSGMALESTPEMSMPVLMVMTSYSGASPDEVDEMVTDAVESALSSITEVETMTSTSSEGVSMTTMEFGYSVDLDDKYQDVTSALAMINLPDGCGDPTVLKMSMDSSTILSLSVEAGEGGDVLAYVEENIVPEIERIAGVSDVSTTGGTKDYIQVLLDENKMSQYRLSMQDISSAIASSDFETTLGTAKRGSITLDLIGSSEYEHYYDLENIPISLSNGSILHLSDVAVVSVQQEERSSYSRENGMDIVQISVSKNQDANTIQICNEVTELVEQLNRSGLGLQIEVISNSGESIMDSIESVVSSLVLGLIVAIFVLFLFFGEWKSCVIVGLSMPLSVLTALILMSVFGMTINMMSLGGLVVGIGMLVDNSIVVLESCMKARTSGSGQSFAACAVGGANLVAGSVVASTITTIVVFLPISLMEGMSGQLFKEVGFTIIFSLTASLVSALTLVPLLFVRLRPVEKVTSLTHRVMDVIESGYAVLIRKALNARALVVLIAVACLVGTGMMFSTIRMELMPSMDDGSISLTVETKNGLDLDSVNAIVEQIEVLVRQEPDVESFSVSVGSGGGMRGMMGGGGSASISITLKDERTMSTDEFVNRITEQTSGIENCHIEASKQDMMSMMMSNKVELNLRGESLTVLEEVAGQLRERMETMDTFTSVTTSLSDGSPRARIIVDPVLAGSVGMTPSSVLSAASSKISGLDVMKYTENGTEYTITLEYPPERYENISDLSGLMIDTPMGSQVALTELAVIEYETGPASIERDEGNYLVTVSGVPESGANIQSLSAQAMQLVSDIELPEGVSLSEGGDMMTMTEEFTNIGIALLTAVFLVFAVMAIQFESMRFSLVVMISVPFSLTGAFLALKLTNGSISMTSLIGLVMLVGIVVNNAIVLIDYTSILRQGGEPVRMALIHAGRSRLRPILMSTLTTIVGLIPMAAGFGGKVEMMQGMAVVVIGGLAVSTLLTLVLVPTFYLIFDREDRKDRREKKKQRRLSRKGMRAEKG